MALLVLFFAIYCVKNTTQDLIYAITGRVPPSFVREQRRVSLAREAIAARANARPTHRPVTADRADKRFFRNAYNDAWETAEARRARSAAKRAQKRHAKWGTKEDVPAPLETNVRPEEKSAASTIDTPDVPTPADSPVAVVHDDDTFVVGGKKETLYQRYAMRRRNGGQPMTTVAIADELGTTMAEAEKLQDTWSARYDQETNPDKPPNHLLEYQKHGSCRGCGGGITLNKDPERAGQWIVGVAHNREDCPQDAKRLTPREQHDQQVQDMAERATQDTHTDRAVIDKSLNDLREDELPLDMTEWDRAGRPGGDSFQDYIDNHPNGHRYTGFMAQRPDAPARAESVTASNTKENDSVTSNTETTGLQSGMAYNDEMAKTCEQGAASVEQSIAALMNGEVGQGVTGPMHQAQEHLAAAQALFEDARRTLEQQLTVKEAYDANPDAGNKQFVTAE